MTFNIEIVEEPKIIHYLKLKSFNEQIKLSTALNVLDHLIKDEDFYCPSTNDELTFCKWLKSQLDENFNPILRTNIFNTGYITINEKVRNDLCSWYIRLLNTGYNEECDY